MKDAVPLNTETGEVSATNTQVHAQSDDVHGEGTEVKEPLPADAAADGVRQERTSDQPQGASGGDQNM